MNSLLYETRMRLTGFPEPPKMGSVECLNKWFAKNCFCKNHVLFLLEVISNCPKKAQNVAHFTLRLPFMLFRIYFQCPFSCLMNWIYSGFVTSFEYLEIVCQKLFTVTMNIFLAHSYKVIFITVIATHYVFIALALK